MEQERGKIIRIVRLGELGQFASFAAFMAFAFYFFVFAFGTVVQGLLFFSLALAIPLYAIGLRLGSSRVASLAWAVLGTFLILSFAILNPSYNSASTIVLVALVLLIIASFEQTRFSFAIDPVIRASRSFQSQEELGRLARVIRNHALILFQVVGITILASAVVLYLAEGSALIVNPPMVGVPILAALAVLIVASMSATIFPKPVVLKTNSGEVQEEEP